MNTFCTVYSYILLLAVPATLPEMTVTDTGGDLATDYSVSRENAPQKCERNPLLLGHFAH